MPVCFWTVCGKKKWVTVCDNFSFTSDKNGNHVVVLLPQDINAWVLLMTLCDKLTIKWICTFKVLETSIPCHWLFHCRTGLYDVCTINNWFDLDADVLLWVSIAPLLFPAKKHLCYVSFGSSFGTINMRIR